MSHTKTPLFNFLKGFLPKFLPRELAEPILSAEAYKIFERAFTHPDVNRNFHYEMLEFLGDSVIKAAFSIYIFQKYPEINEPGQISILNNYFLEKEFFAGLSDKYGFTKYIRVPSNREPTIDEREDIFESFAGALQLTGDQFIGEYVGQMLVRRFVFMIFDNIKIDTSNLDKYRNYVQVLKEKFFDPKKAKMEFEKIKKSDTVMVVNILYKNTVIGTGSGRNVEEAKYHAAYDALVKQVQSFKKDVEEKVEEQSKSSKKRM